MRATFHATILVDTLKRALTVVFLGCSARAIAPAPDASPKTLVLETTAGVIHCVVDGRAPRADAMVTSLAHGGAAWRDPSGAVVTKPYYDDIAFFRVIPGVLVQTGCHVGDGSGTPGYRIPLEVTPDDAARLAKPGALFLAHYNAPPNRTDPHPPGANVIGAQLVIGLTDMSHLAGSVTVVGSCSDLAVTTRISETSGRLVRAVVR
jgi:peptidyl-prolyl cis-trans isomerase A (cyclophilin A)